MATFGFNTKTVPDFETLPAGEYEVVIENVEMKEWDNRDRYLSICLSILSGKFQGRKLFDSATYDSADRESASLKFGKRRIKQLCLAVGFEQISDTDQLINRSLVAKIGVYTPKDEGKEPRNTVQKYQSRNPVQASHAVETALETPVVAAPQSIEPVTDCPF